jgi:hypothetical protein
VREHASIGRALLAPLLLSLILGVASSAHAKETNARGPSAKASRATPAATARPRSKARPTSNAKQARPSAKRATGKASPPAEPAPAAAPASAEAATPSEQSAAKPDAAGVKTFTFKAQEIEGRLKAPQILYFLRRVRAEFDAQALGHRSFLLELSDTRRQQALR